MWCTGRERLESNAWDDEDAAAYWWLVKSNGGTVSVTERDKVLRGALVPGTTAQSGHRQRDVALCLQHAQRLSIVTPVRNIGAGAGILGGER